MQQQQFRDTQFQKEFGPGIHRNGDPYPFGRLEQKSGWERALNMLGRLFGRYLTRVERYAQRVVIQVEITHLRLRACRQSQAQPCQPHSQSRGSRHGSSTLVPPWDLPRTRSQARNRGRPIPRPARIHQSATCPPGFGRLCA